MLSQRSIGAGGNLLKLPSDDEFNRVSFLSHFDGENNGVNNVFDDGSASNHTITANGNVTQGSFGPFARPEGEWAVDATAEADRLTLANTTDLNFSTGEFSVEFWVNLVTDYSSSGGIISMFFWATNAGNQTQFSQRSDLSGGIGLNFFTDGSHVLKGGGVIAEAGSWNHVVLCRSGTTLSIFLNGSRTSTATYSSAITFNDTPVIMGYNGTAHGANGNMSNFRVLKGSSAYDATQTTLTVPTSPLTAVTNTKLLTCQSNRFIDNSASPLTISLVGNPSVSAFGPFLTTSVYDPASNAASAYFDGSGDGLTGPTSSDFQFGDNSFTVEAWIYPTVIDNYNAVIGTVASTGAGRWYISYGVTSMYWGTYGNGTDGDLIITHGMAPNAWYHLAYVRNKSDDKGRMYINGVQKGVWDDARTYGNPANPLNIGKDYAGNDMNGYISDARVVKGTAVYTSAFTPPTAPLTAITNTKLLLNMTDGQAIDSAAQNNLTLYGNAKLSTGQAKFGDTSIVFDGTGDYAFINNGFPAIGTGDFTVEFWMNPSEVSGDFALFDSRNASTANHPTLWKRVAGLYFFVASGERITISSGLSVGTWAHVALVRSSGVYKLYLNGTASGTTYANTDSLAVKDLYIGARYSDEYYYDGYLDDFRISKMARYTSNFTAPTEPFADKGQ